MIDDRKSLNCKENGVSCQTWPVRCIIVVGKELINWGGYSMGVTLFVNIGIIILSAFGFVSTTYGGKLSELPDQFDNPAIAIGFGLTGLVTSLAVLGIASVLSTLLLVNILLYLNIW